MHATVQGVAVDPSRPAVIYAATWFGGVFRSEDSGATWNDLSEYGTIADVVNVNVEDPSNPNLLLAGTAGLRRPGLDEQGPELRAAGRTGSRNLYVNAVAFDPGSPSTVYAATDGGLFKSTSSRQPPGPRRR